MTTPGAPNIKAFPLASQSTLQYWWKPPTEGGADVTDYELTVTPGPYTFRLPGDATYCTVEGLSDDTFYSASIRATCNYPDWGPSSNFYDWQPGLPPSYAPQNPTATRVELTGALITWNPPLISPQSPIFWYALTTNSTNPADTVYTFTASGTEQRSYYITDLTSTSTYYFTLEAVNCPGYSPIVSTNSIRYSPFYIEVSWATALSSSATGSAASISVDTSGNVYVCGQYSAAATATLLSASGNGQSASPVTLPTGTGIAFLVKYNTNGAVQWAINILNTNSLCDSIKNDNIGSIYVSGYTYGTSVVVDASGNGQTNSSISLNTLGAFLIKYNTNGRTQWAITLNATTTSEINDFVLDSSGNIYITGAYNNTSQFNLRNATSTGQTASSYTLQGTTTNAAYFAKYSPTGQVQWATRFDGTASDRAQGIAIDSLSNIYATGRYLTSAATLQNANGFGQSNSSISLSAATTSGSMFLVKYNSSGQAQWATNITTGSSEGYSVAIDTNDNIYVVGDYSTSSDIFVRNASGNGQVNSSIQLKASSGGNDVFLIKYTTSGQAVWATRIQGTGIDNGYGICCDSSGNIYVTGTYISTANLVIENADGNTQTPSSLTLGSTGSTTGVFVVKYSPDGIALTLTGINGGGSDSVDKSIFVDSAFNLYLGGQYINNGAVLGLNNTRYNNTFTSSGVTLPSTTTSSRPFIVKYLQLV